MVETTQSIFNAKDELPLVEMLEACHGRCRGAHFGTYDYTASCDVLA